MPLRTLIKHKDVFEDLIYEILYFINLRETSCFELKLKDENEIKNFLKEKK